MPKMIGYICKYTPINIFKVFGQEIIKIEPENSNFENADSFMHPNMCTYSKAVLEECINSKIDEIILVSCCDSIRRLYDVLKEYSNFKFIYILDVPRKDTSEAVNLFKLEIYKLIKSYEDYSSTKFDYKKLHDLLKTEIKNINISNSKPRTALLGARCSNSILNSLQSSGFDTSFNFTCTGNKSFNGNFDIDIYDDVVEGYSAYLLSLLPCMRMSNSQKRQAELSKIKDSLVGIIYHTVKFCDAYSYDYAKIKNSVNIPILKIETDYSKQCEGQIKTRVDAFIETIQPNNITKKSNISTSSVGGDTYVLGIDSGSTSTNAVIMDRDMKIKGFSIVSTGPQSSIGAQKAYDEVLKTTSISKDQIKYIVATGYGRVSIPFSNETVTEISCHAKGAFYFNKDIRTIIDIGGQDSKVIRLDDDGNVKDFAMNDKCAAGTGRFLDMMSRTLEIPLDKMGIESQKSKKEISITSMCTVFAESEVVSLIAKNVEIPDILNGLNNSISSKTYSLIERIGKKGCYAMTGGVAKNIGVVKALENKIGEKIFIPQEPQIVGAVGAALIALEHIVSSN